MKYCWTLIVALMALPVLGCGGGGGGGTPVAAFVVTSTADAGAGSLRDVFAAAPAGSTITFQAGLGTINLTSGPIDIDKPITIEGPGASDQAIDGGNSVDLFLVQPSVTCEVSGLTLQDGGKGFENRGTATLRNVVIEGCSASFGGAFETRFGSLLTLIECTFRNNSAFNGGGGAVNNGGTLVARRCTWHNNTTTGNAGGALVLVDGVVTCVNCTFSENMATGSGNGGAIGAFDDATISDVTLIACTLVLNSAGGDGGGIIASASDLTCRACIIAANTAGGTGPDILFDVGGTFTSGGRNVVGIDAGNGFVNGVMNDQVGTTGTPLDPLVGARADNGGPTLTHALLAGSPALDQVPPAECLDENGNPLGTDQRNVARPNGTNCDVGAVEQ
ncbi:MAG: choice-of-anchor Q domain-containing protein [Planctomycetota bacterium]|nr:choice-of-anchor Q domain-containing protein [Planctomycetota bacterium]